MPIRGEGARGVARLRCVQWLYMSRVVLQVFLAPLISDSLVGCSAKDSYSFPAQDVLDTIRRADLSARSPGADRQSGATIQAGRPLLVPGSDAEAASSAPPAGDAQTGGRLNPPGANTPGANAPGANASAAGVEFNFDGADIQTVAKTLLGDTLGLSYVVDPRVQGTVTFSSVGPIARKDVLPIFESVLRMSSAAVVREGNLVKIIPIPEAAGAGAVSAGAGQPGFGVSVVPLHYTSAASVARMTENFLSRPGAIRADQARNLLLIQGTSVERQSALDVIATFDVRVAAQSIGRRLSAEVDHTRDHDSGA